VTSPTTPEVDLSVTKAVSPNPLEPGSPAVYALVVTNNGPSDATAVVLNDTPPAGETLVSFTATQGDCSSLSPLTCQLGAIPVGSSAEVTDPLPADVSGATASPTGGPCTVASGRVTCTVSQLAAGAAMSSRSGGRWPPATRATWSTRR
jgi:uncharacterized repeat protein (TIGR01451 family)